MSLKSRFNLFFDEVGVMSVVPARALAESTSGGERDNAPKGAFRYKDEDRIEEILTDALRQAEKLVGRVWKNGRYVADRPKTFDEREWTLHILKDYRGVRNGIVAAEEQVEHYVVRDLRKRHGFDGNGNPKDDFITDKQSTMSLRREALAD